MSSRRSRSWSRRWPPWPLRRIASHERRPHASHAPGPGARASSRLSGRHAPFRRRHVGPHQGAPRPARRLRHRPRSCARRDRLGRRGGGRDDLVIEHHVHHHLHDHHRAPRPKRILRASRRSPRSRSRRSPRSRSLLPLTRPWKILRPRRTTSRAGASAPRSGSWPSGGHRARRDLEPAASTRVPACVGGSKRVGRPSPRSSRWPGSHSSRNRAFRTARPDRPRRMPADRARRTPLSSVRATGLRRAGGPTGQKARSTARWGLIPRSRAGLTGSCEEPSTRKRCRHSSPVTRIAARTTMATRFITETRVTRSIRFAASGGSTPARSTTCGCGSPRAHCRRVAPTLTWRSSTPPRAGSTASGTWKRRRCCRSGARFRSATGGGPDGECGAQRALAATPRLPSSACPEE